MTSINDILTFFHQKFCRGATLLSSLLPTGFTAITDHPSTGEVPLDRTPQRVAPPVNIPISFWSQAAWSVERSRVLSRASLSLSLNVEMFSHCSGQIPKTIVLYYTCVNTGRGEFTPRESEVKTQRTPIVYRLPRCRLN
jgi:hypothetical protein